MANEKGEEGEKRCVQDRVDAATVALPHRAEARLAANVPQLDDDAAARHLAHVEADSWDHVVLERSALAALGEDHRLR